MSIGCTHGTQHSEISVFYCICTHQLQFMHTARHKASSNSLHVFCRADIMCPVDADSSYPGVYPVKTAGWARKTYQKTWIGQEVPRERTGEVHMRTRNWALALLTFGQEFMHYILSCSQKDHPHPKQQSHNTAFVGSQLGWVMDLSFVAQFKHCGGFRRTSLSCHFSLWVSSGIFRFRVVSQSCPSAKSQQKINSLKWKAEFCREPGL